MARFQATVYFDADNMTEARDFVFSLLLPLGEALDKWALDAIVKEVDA